MHISRPLVPAAVGKAGLALRLRLLSGQGYPYAIRNDNQTSDGTAIPPRRQPIHLTQATERIGEPYLHVDPAKVIAVVETCQGDRNTAFAPPDAGE